MLIADAEKLKNELTDKYVVVNENVPELKRFVGLTGRVKTVNMNCRALVEFDGPVDISWYDIDPSCLIVVDAPQPKAKQAAPAAESKKAAAPKKPSGGKSPLEMARAQGAGGGDGEKKLSPLELARQQGAGGGAQAKPAPEGDKKLSPLEQARQQGAASSGSAPVADKPLSPLEQARQQGAVKSADAPAESQETPAAAEDSPEPEPTADAAQPAKLETPGSTAEILELCRQQGAFKG